jgi:ribonuclease Y
VKGTLELFELLFYFGAGLFGGGGSIASFYGVRGVLRKKSAREEADRLREQARTRAEKILQASQQTATELENRMKLRVQKEVGQKQQRLKQLEHDLRNKQSQQDRHFADLEKEFQSVFGPVLNSYQAVQKRDEELSQRQRRLAEVRTQLADACESRSGDKSADLLRPLVDRFVEDETLFAKRRWQAWEEDVKLRSEQLAKQILGTVLCRFPREYCSERGIGIVAFPSENVKQKLTANDSQILKRLGELCGVDLLVQENNTISVSGFDPVRRELTTRCLERLVSTRDPSLNRVEQIVEDTKRDLFKRIENDGNAIARELNQENLDPEIKRMLGSLRYRYSFAQNQYFHVGEVGWLCGLLAAELGDVVSDGKRAGLLHDVGKAMDHSIEGGHAVIGADFIQQHGESPHIVHAVRSHHFEEQPSTDLAFLVIAADAISGARPGARRSTVTAYNQKMEMLENIGEQYPGVSRTLVFNAGREVRLIVDSHRVSDQEALSLGKTVAEKIESDLTYPGTIKVVVVRETVAEALAK